MFQSLEVVQWIGTLGNFGVVTERLLVDGYVALVAEGRGCKHFRIAIQVVVQHVYLHVLLLLLK